MIFKKILPALCLLITGYNVFAQEASPSTDGPYLFYKQDKGYTKSIQVIEGKAQVKVDSFSIKDKAGKVLSVEVENHPDWNFKVKLRNKLESRKAIFPSAEPMLFLSDIEGEFTAFRELLLANRVIDKNYNWIFGKGRLVIAGDLFDRGKQVVPYLWLLYRLEDDARAKGGDVNLVLGNHDIMNLKGDFRYVQPVYLANAKLLGQAYGDLYGPDTELGQWLRSKNIIEKIGDILVMHGGLSPAVLHRGLSVDQINNISRPFYDRPTKQLPDSLVAILGNQGLFWYRGYFAAPKASVGTVDSTLKQYDVKHIVVGHTIIKQNIGLYYGGKVVGIDVNEHKGDRAAALYTKGEWYLLDLSGNRKKLVYDPANDSIKKEDID